MVNALRKLGNADFSLEILFILLSILVFSYQNLIKFHYYKIVNNECLEFIIKLN